MNPYAALALAIVVGLLIAYTDHRRAGDRDAA